VSESSIANRRRPDWLEHAANDTELERRRRPIPTFFSATAFGRHGRRLARLRPFYPHPITRARARRSQIEFLKENEYGV